MVVRWNDIIHGRLGWCPHAPALKPRVPGTPGLLQAASAPAGIDPPSAQDSPAAAVVPRWMDAVGVVILFATFFVGGFVWWPLFVLSVIVVMTIILCRGLQGRGG